MGDERANVKPIMALAVAMFTMAMGIGFIIPLLPVYAETLGAGGLWIGLIFGANPFFRAIFMPVFGRLSDLKGRKPYLIIGLAGSSAVAMLMGMSGMAWHLFILRMVQGILSAMVMPISRAYVGILTPRGREGSVMGYFNLAFFLGFALGPLVGGALSDALGLRPPFFAMAGLSAVSLVIVHLLVPEQEGTAASGRKPAAPVRDVIKSPIIRGLAWGRACNAMGRGIFASLMPVFAATFLLLSRTQVGFLISLGSLFASGLQPLAGWLSDRMNRKYLATAGFLLAPVGLFLIPSARSFYHLLGIALIMGMSPGLFVPSSTAISVVEGRKHGMGSTMALVEMAMALGMSAGSTGGGAVAEIWGVTSAFYTASFMTLTGTFVFLWHLREYQDPVARRAQQEETVTG